MSPHTDTRDLRAFFARRATRAFNWGTSDCATFAFDAVHAQTGRDVVADLRGTYLSAMGAARLLHRFGGLPGLADDRLGPRLKPLHARDGDVALLSASVCDATEGRVGALGVVFGDSIVAQGEAGLVVVPRSSALVFWSVPRG